MKQTAEIEAKFRVASHTVFADLLSLTQLGPFRLLPAPQPEQQHNIYYDTTAHELRNAKHGFRIRILPGSIIATLKGPATQVGSAQSRSELEVPLTTADPSAIPTGELAERLHALTNSAALVALLTIDTQRQIIDVFREQHHVLEIALDAIQIKAGNRSQAGIELEIECVETGTTSDLEALVALLTPRYQLVPEPLSKLARGLALLETP